MRYENETKEKVHCEFDYNGQKITYDGCSEQPLQEAKKWYGENWKHIGSGYITYHNGVQKHWKNLHHFFKYEAETTPENIA